MGARVLITGGGTGGHLYPALNLADALRRRDPDAELLYVGSRRGLEADVLPGRDLDYELLPVGPLHRGRPWRSWRTVASAPAALAGALRAGGGFDPDVVVGTGGYASGPAVLWAWTTGRPLALQEQNAEPGLVTRWMASRADQLHLGFPEAEGRLRPGKGTEVFAHGNPVARPGEAGTEGTTFDWPDGRVLLVAGGSQGAEGINRRLLADLREVRAWPADLAVVWIAGPDHAGELEGEVGRLPWGDRIRVVPYIDDLGRQLDRVTMAVARAGAMFVSELAAAGVPAVFVPYPAAAGGHQRANARALEEAGAAVVREEAALRDGQLWRLVARLLADEGRLQTMARAAAGRGSPDAADRIAADLLRLAGVSSAARDAGPGRLARREDLPAPDGRAHLVGAGGAGMRGLAGLLAGAGWAGRGCDASASARAPEITRRGGRLEHGHDPGHVEGAGLVVRSAAVPADHPEIEAARERDVPVWGRARALAALVNDATMAAIGGTHGKTTITAMAALAARAGGVDATGVVGGVVPAWDAHAVAGAGPVVVEADEYEAAFLELDPDLAVVSAVEPEHLESFDGLEGMKAAYRRFAGRAADRIGVLYCADEPGARELGESLDEAVGYGFDRGAAYRVRGGEAGEARLEAPEGSLSFRLAAPGQHNLQNAAAGLAVALRLGADPAGLEDALADFRGVERRLQELADAGGVAVVDDYAHHPTEVRASLGAVRRAYPGRRVVAVFQPHLYSRTRRFAADFAAALAGADRAVVLPIYPAREEPIPGVGAELIVEAGEALERVDRDDALELVRELGDGRAVALFMGAGDVTELAHRAADEVSGRAVGA